jgi:release factor glutamine methyltransferase
MSADQQTAGDLRDRAERALAAAGVPTARGDADIIVAHVLGLRRADVQDGQRDGQALTPEQAALATDFIERRTRREPLQHLTGKALFRDLELAVGPGVFVPRRESEFVAGLAIEALRAAGDGATAVDLGTGAGAIALSMATEVPGATVYGVEVSPEAYAWTQRNVDAIAPDSAVAVLGDMARALPELDGHVDVVSANPPFVPDGTPAPTPEVALFDPAEALYGGPDGFDLIRSVSTTARRLLRPGGTLAMEHGVSQAGRVAELLRADGWESVVSHRDPRGQDRVTTARR